MNWKSKYSFFLENSIDFRVVWLGQGICQFGERYEHYF